MLPVVFPPAGLRVVLAGAGDAALRRLALLDAAGVTDLRVFSPDGDGPLAGAAGARLTAGLPGPEDFARARLVFVAGLDEETSARLAGAARAAGAAVNVEDRRALCDFHVPAQVRRGDLLLTVSTAGAGPGLASRLRAKLEDDFGPEWGDRLAEFADVRAAWRAEGAGMADLSRRSREWLDRKGWFD